MKNLLPIIAILFLFSCQEDLKEPIQDNLQIQVVDIDQVNEIISNIWIDENATQYRMSEVVTDSCYLANIESLANGSMSLSSTGQHFIFVRKCDRLNVAMNFLRTNAYQNNFGIEDIGQIIDLAIYPTLPPYYQNQLMVQVIESDFDPVNWWAWYSDGFIPMSEAFYQEFQ